MTLTAFQNAQMDTMVEIQIMNVYNVIMNVRNVLVLVLLHVLNAKVLMGLITI
jgi:hypothetical protein